MKRCIGFLLALALTLAPLAALASGTATLITHDGKTVNVAWQDDNMLRMDMPDSSDYMIQRDGKLYMITTAAGQTRVIEMGNMLKSFGNLAKIMGGQQSSIEDASIDSIKDTGTSQTIAGIKGEVYRVTASHDGKTETSEVVLTDNPLVVEMTEAYLNVIEAVGYGDKAAQIKDKFPGKNQGILGVKDNFHLKSISSEAPATSEFELPAKPQNLGNILNNMMNKMKSMQ